MLFLKGHFPTSLKTITWPYKNLFLPYPILFSKGWLDKLGREIGELYL